MSVVELIAIDRYNHTTGRHKMRKTNILLIDNFEVFREGLTNLLQSEPGIEVQSVSATVPEIDKVTRRHKPDVVLIDIEWRESIEAILHIRQIAPNARTIIITHSKESVDFFIAMSAGAAGYVLKDINYKDLVKVIALVIEGKLVIDQHMATVVTCAFEFIHSHRHVMIKPKPVSLLTDQERAVVALLVKDATNKEIASTLCITENTAKIHIRNIMRKLHVHSRLEASIYAIEEGLVNGIYETQGKNSAYNSS